MTPEGTMLSVIRRITCSTLLAFTLAPLTPAIAQETPRPPRIHLIYMGGNDCPPCVAWRANELPKLERSEAWKAMRFSFVVKLIRSGVPSSFFLPDEVKPYKEKLDAASNGRTGSPHFALIVDDEVYDYYFGIRSADSVARMIEAVRDHSPYPYDRCVKIAGMGKCAVKG
jgi:hypothetical protein